MPGLNWTSLVPGLLSKNVLWLWPNRRVRVAGPAACAWCVKLEVGHHASHGAHVASEMTFNQLSISAGLLHACCTELPTDPHAPDTTPMRITARGSLRAPKKVHHAHLEVGMACMAFTQRSIDIFERVWSLLAIAHFTGSRSPSCQWLKPPVPPVRRLAGQVARSDRSGNVVSQGRVGPLK